MGWPAQQANWRDRLGSKRERLIRDESLAFRSESGYARRFATPIDVTPRSDSAVSAVSALNVTSAFLRDSVSLWQTVFAIFASLVVRHRSRCG